MESITYYLIRHYWFPCLYVILIVFEHDVCITFHLIVIVCMWTWVIYPIFYLTACCMTALLLRDCMSPVHVGHTSIPLPPTLLASVIPFISVLTITSVRPSVCLLFWLSQRLGIGSSDRLYRCLGASRGDRHFDVDWSPIIEGLYSPKLSFMDICVASVFSLSV